jgi:hypothetical protein
MKNKIYQLVSFVNAFNKKAKRWESLHNVSKVYVGKEGLKTAYAEFEKEKNRYESVVNWLPSKYSEARGKVEVQEPHIHENGSLAYWGDKVIISHNPQNI